MNKKKVKKYKDNDFYFVGFKNPPFLQREHLNDFTKEEFIRLYTETVERLGDSLWRISFLERLINYLGSQDKSKLKPNKKLLFKMEYVKIYTKLYKKFKNHSKTAANIDKDKDYKLLKKFGSI